MRRFLFLIPLVAFVIVATAFGLGLNRDPSKLPSVLIGRPLPQFTLPPVRPNDSGLASADIRGAPVLLNVFASWCVSCRIEHPLLLALKARGVAIDGLDWKDQSKLAMQFLDENGDPYRNVGADESGRTAIDLGVTGAPETFVVDRRGRVRYKQVGVITPEVWSTVLEPLMRKLRTEP